MKRGNSMFNMNISGFHDSSPLWSIILTQSSWLKQKYFQKMVQWSMEKIDFGSSFCTTPTANTDIAANFYSFYNKLRLFWLGKLFFFKLTNIICVHNSPRIKKYIYLPPFTTIHMFFRIRSHGVQQKGCDFGFLFPGCCNFHSYYYILLFNSFNIFSGKVGEKLICVELVFFSFLVIYL